MKMVLKIVPPTSTAQMKKVRVVSGRPMFYETAKVKEAKSVLMAALREYAPAEPMTGALELRCFWRFPKGRHHEGEWRSTRPDTDNLQKMLKDCMTALGFWVDDSQVACELVKKWWSADPGIDIQIEKL